MISRNPLLIGARGGLGKVVVFKQMYGKTVMTNYPRKVTIPREKQSAAQRGTRDNFREAAAYAKHVLKNLAQKKFYEKRKKRLGLYSAYQAAITDYMRKLRQEPETTVLATQNPAWNSMLVNTVKKVMPLSKKSQKYSRKHKRWSESRQCKMVS
jgi:hypothetical protein